MNSPNKFTTGFMKIAAPAWFYEMNKTMHPLKSMKNYSAKRITATNSGRKLK